MITWLARKLMPWFIRAVAKSMVELDPDKHYLLFLPADVDEKELQKQIKPLQDNLNMLILTVDHFRIFEF